MWKVSFSPDGKAIVSSSADAAIKVWDVAKPRPHKAAEWELVQGEHFPGDPSYAPLLTFCKNSATGDVRREDSTAGV